MADLTISGASFGMSSKGTQKYIEDLKANVLDVASKKLESEILVFTQNVNAYWQGVSKDRFVKQISDDALTLSKKIKALQNTLFEAFSQLQTSLEKFDEGLETTSIFGRRN